LGGIGDALATKISGRHEADRRATGWMEQVARNATMQDTGSLNGCRYLLHDRDQKFCREFREFLAAGGVKCLPLPARSPNRLKQLDRLVAAC